MVIGFIVGGILVGQDLIKAAAIRAQISQIEQYNTAVHTFQAKYNCLPGDCANAAQFGFPARGAYAGEGDGNGIIQGNNTGGNAGGLGYVAGMGESPMFWVDLSKAGLIEGSFTAASPNSPNGLPSVAQSALGSWFPAAKIGNGNYIYVWSGGLNWPPNADSNNYFAVSAVTSLFDGYNIASNATISVNQAYMIDAKSDDGLPFSGKLTAMYLNAGPAAAPTTAPGWSVLGDSLASAGSATTCADNSVSSTGSPGIVGSPWRYSTEINNGASMNCALSFQFQ